MQVREGSGFEQEPGSLRFITLYTTQLGDYHFTIKIPAAICVPCPGHFPYLLTRKYQLVCPPVEGATAGSAGKAGRREVALPASRYGRATKCPGPADFTLRRFVCRDTSFLIFASP